MPSNKIQGMLHLEVNGEKIEFMCVQVKFSES